MGRGSRREANSNWRGGKSISSNGYVIVRVDSDHPLADIRGYAYEHRLVASGMLGRPLFSHEQVHHIDEDKKNNDPSNLRVVSSHAEHAVEHRKREDLRMPREDNPTTTCECGCGICFSKYDYDGRPRRFVSGHNRNASPSQGHVLDLIVSGKRFRRDIVRASSRSRGATIMALQKLYKSGKVNRVGIGEYEIIHEWPNPSHFEIKDRP